MYIYTWTQKTAPPYIYVTGTAAAVDGKIHADWSQSNSNRPGFHYMYDPNNDTWTQKTAGSSRRYFPYSVGYGKKWYVGGGWDGDTFQRRVDWWEYDSDSNGWTQKTNFPGTGRNQACCFVIYGTGKIYVGTGSQGGTPYLADFWEYDSTGNNWTQKTDYPVAGYGYGSCGTDTKGYLGLTAFVVGKRWYEYDPVGNSWTVKADPSLAGTDEGIAYMNGKLWTQPHGYHFNYYNPADNSWNLIVSIPDSGGYYRNRPFVVNASENIHLFSGQGSGYNGMDLWKLTITEWLTDREFEHAHKRTFDRRKFVREDISRAKVYEIK